MAEVIKKTIELAASEEPNIMVTESEYKGNKGKVSPMLNLIYMGGGRPYPFSFSVAKAKMILFSIDKIKEFYEKNKSQLGSGD